MSKMKEIAVDGKRDKERNKKRDEKTKMRDRKERQSERMMINMNRRNV